MVTMTTAQKKFPSIAQRKTTLKELSLWRLICHSTKHKRKLAKEH
uniref:Uncharacterized protein n=1 Tax=Rhizophora mucronata TaxID=61149 RepID=A0A2P2R215_RHIMU